MSTTSPSSEQPSSTTLSQTPPSLRSLHYTLLIATPLLILLPPRKLDLYTFSLSGLFVYSAQELAFGEARRAANTRAGSTGVMGALGRTDVDSTSAQTNVVPLPGVDPSTSPRELLRESSSVPQRQTQGEERESEGGITAMARKLWMGGEEAGWQERRIREEKERLEQGEGYWDLIVGQVWEAFGRDRETGEKEGKE